MPRVAQLATGTRAIRTPAQSARARRAYLPSELARDLGVHKSSIYRWIEKGLLRADASVGFTLIPIA